MNKEKLDIYCYNSPVGGIIIKADGVFLKELNFAQSDPDFANGKVNNEIILSLINQLDEYFCRQRKYFRVSLDFRRLSPFQRLVLKALSQIPYGTTRSYKEVAVSIGKPQSFRPVGAACGRNPYPLIIPCHRVISSQGDIGGFSADIKIKEKLLQIEGWKG